MSSSQDTADYVGLADETKPTDQLLLSNIGAALRQAKKQVKQSFPNVQSEVTATSQQLNYLSELSDSIVNLLADKENISDNDAADILAKLLTVDADDSGLNCSTLQGLAASYFAPNSGNATQAWVNSLGLATQSYVTSRGYLTSVSGSNIVANAITNSKIHWENRTSGSFSVGAGSAVTFPTAGLYSFATATSAATAELELYVNGDWRDGETGSPLSGTIYIPNAGWARIRNNSGFTLTVYWERLA